MVLCGTTINSTDGIKYSITLKQKVNLFCTIANKGYVKVILFIVSVFILTHLISYLEARDISKGDNLFLSHVAIALFNHKNNSFTPVAIDEVKKYQEQGYSLTPKQPTGKIQNINENIFDFSYQAFEKKQGMQLIKTTIVRDDDTTYTSYLVKDNEIIPLKTRLFYMGYMFTAVAICGGLLIVLEIVTGLLRRFYVKDEK